MWRVTASARGYVTQAYDEHESFSSGVVLTKDSPEMHLRFRISPEAVITGTVLDEAGEPVRNARLSLLALHAPGPDSIQPPARTRASVVTDDRGYYEFDGLLPGDYRISVQAQVWYATAAQQRRLNPSDQTPLDPSLDVAYPLTWYPGTSDPAEAETLSLGQGDSRQANFQLLPVPSVHLHIQPDTSAMTTGRRIQSYPMIERISAGGGGYIPLTSVHIDPQGAIDVGGLSPGRYEVRMQGPGQQMKPALVDVTAGSSQTLDMSTASAMANVTIHINEASDAGANSVQVSLIDPETGRNAARDSSGAYLLSGALLRQRRTTVADHTVVVPPGRYEVVLNGRPELYLTGMSAQSAEVTGRFVTVTSGNSTLDLHVANGRASVTGIAAMQGKPSVGAMVLLVPATLGNPDGLNTIRRDQTNTDGSFDLKDVLPGQYILLAIDRGWQVNWKDPSTLHGYMMHGVPVVLTPEASLKENIETQAP
ncbi:MAG: carboxypeptidase-like regulatory domain-containing protein, partial [Edaphobacter sp.]